MRALFTSLVYTALTDASQSVPQARAVQREPAPLPRRRFANLRRPIAAVIGGLVSFILLAGAAQGKSSVFLPAPSYPDSRLAIKVAGKPRAGGIVKVVVSGSNAPFEAGFPGSRLRRARG
jgi:hypothetical protein